MYVSVIIPTYNRLEDLIQTIPQIASILDDQSELIIYDQSDSYRPETLDGKLKGLLGNQNYTYIHSETPSVTLAWNTAATLAKGEVLLFLDDDIDLISNIIEDHRKYYRAQNNIVGVAGSYYAGSVNRPWVPSSKHGIATTCAGVNISIRTETFLKTGAASDYIKPFAGFDWEFAEFVTKNYGKLAVGNDLFVMHRAPASGGCGNQAERGIDWYYGCYFNHFLWMFSRRGLFKFSRLPRHVYWLMRYCIPPKHILMTTDFFRQSILEAFVAARKKHHRNARQRRAEKSRSTEYNVCSEVRRRSS
ncbi:glycosyltransferase [Marinobacter manganoxydans]|uniref:Glycosyltransferase 2-like domain-containing protein n=1 Tax=Marinobacter manganoxydans MnI7-9 TaxID=1094979 RepID=G6YRK5_9GAMM|nr:glycosyltransferase [Marinobacter manganoxydans]EHJ05136.1 hypothetical protein KYE_07412 [Marinobacter manganoxydans MnI7-9]